VRQASPDGAIVVTVDGYGGLLDLRLSEGISRLSPAEFSRSVHDTAAAAVRQAFRRRADFIDEFNH
jgi:hypothetical protein